MSPAGTAGSADVERLARGAAVQIGGKLLGRGSGFALQMVLAQLLGPAAYGLYALGFTVFQITGLAASMGLEHGAVRFASRHLDEDPERLGATLRRALLIGLMAASGIALLLFLASGRLEALVQKPGLAPVLVLFAAGLPLFAGLRIAAAGTRVSQRMHYSTVAEDLVQPLTSLLLVAVFWLAGWRLLGVVGATVASYGVAMTLALVFLLRLFPAAGSSTPGTAPPARELLTFSAPTALAGLLGFLTVWTDRLMVGYLLPAQELGIYSAISYPATLFSLLLTAFNAVFSPMIAELYQKGELRRLAELFRVSTRWGLYLGTPAFLALAFFPGEIVETLLDPRFRPGAWPMVVLAGGQMTSLATGAVGFLLVMSGRQKRWMLLSGLALAANVLLNAWWIPRYGLLGAASASAVVLAGLFALALAGVRVSMRLWPWDRRIVKGLAAAAACAGVLALIRSAGSGASFPAPVLALVLAASYAVFWAVVAALGFEAEDRAVFQRIARRATDGSPRKD